MSAEKQPPDLAAVLRERRRRGVVQGLAWGAIVGFFLVGLYLLSFDFPLASRRDVLTQAGPLLGFIGMLVGVGAAVGFWQGTVQRGRVLQDAARPPTRRQVIRRETVRGAYNGLVIGAFYFGLAVVFVAAVNPQQLQTNLVGVVGRGLLVVLALVAGVGLFGYLVGRGKAGQFPSGN